VRRVQRLKSRLERMPVDSHIWRVFGWKGPSSRKANARGSFKVIPGSSRSARPLPTAGPARPSQKYRPDRILCPTGGHR
jgi:hypothetical protein